MHPKHTLLIFLLAVAGTDFLVAMHPGEASAASSSNTETESHHLDISYEGPIDHVWNDTGKKYTEFTFVDMQEQKAVKTGYHLEIKEVTIRNGKEKYISAKDKHKSPFAYRIGLMLTERLNPDLKRPKDLEGIELHVAYGFGYDEYPINYCDELSNGTNAKMVIVKIPKNENKPTEEEKKILKGIFIGGHKFRVEVRKDGNAEIKFQKNSPGTMKFTASYSNFYSEKGQMVKEPYAYGQGQEDFEFENISLPKSTFTINWAKSNIKEAEELRTVEIGIRFELKDNKHLKVPDAQLGHFYRRIPFQDLPYDTLEKIYVGSGEATIHLSSENNGNSEIEIAAAPVTKPKSVYGTLKSYVKLG